MVVNIALVKVFQIQNDLVEKILIMKKVCDYVKVFRVEVNFWMKIVLKQKREIFWNSILSNFNHKKIENNNGVFVQKKEEVIVTLEVNFPF